MASSADIPSYEWRAPSPPPPWAEAKEEDNQKLKDVKHLLALKHKQVLDFWSKYRAKKRYSDELETIVKELKKDITLKDKILEEEGKQIEQMQDNITVLDNDLGAANKELNDTKKLLE